MSQLPVPPAVVAVAVRASGRAAFVERCLDFLELTKPRIGLLVLLTVFVGGYLGSAGAPDALGLAGALLGTAFVAGGSSVLNHLFERETDAKMARTRNRPLPTGRIAPVEAAWFAAALMGGGLVVLVVLAGALPTALAALSLVLYSFVYTPLKRVTALNTAIGAIPGALPPVIGWTAAGGTIDLGAVLLFGILYVWQFPHFFAIAWLYRDDYANAGLKMLPTSELGRRLTAPQMISYTLALIPLSLAPAVAGLAGTLYFWGALALGLEFLAFGIWFSRNPANERARGVLLASLVYLPTLLTLWTIGMTS